MTGNVACPGTSPVWVLEAAPAEDLALLRLSEGQSSEALDFLCRAVDTGDFISVFQKDGITSAVVSESIIGQHSLHGVEVERQWAALRVSGAAPWPLVLLADTAKAVGLKVKVISAPRNEYILLPKSSLAAFTVGLMRAGHALFPARRVCLPAPAESPGGPGYAKHVGAWTLLRRESPIGTTVAEYAPGHGPLRIQSSSGIYAEVFVPEQRDSIVEQASCAGYHIVEQGAMISTRHRMIDFRPPDGQVLCTQVTFDGRTMIEVSKPRGQYREEYLEVWTKISNDNDKTVALELREETGANAPARPSPRVGYWLLCGTHFARVVGLRRDEGVVASTCCQSLQRLQQLRGLELVETELRSHYEAIRGRVVKAGVLHKEQQAWVPDNKDLLFFDAQAKDGSRVHRSGDSFTHSLSSGVSQKWQVREWGFDPFNGSESKGHLSDSSVSSRKKKTKHKKGRRRHSSSSSRKRSSRSRSNSSAARRKKKDKDKKKKHKKKEDDKKRRKSRSRSRSRRNGKGDDRRKKKRSQSSSRSGRNARKRSSSTPAKGHRSRSRDSRQERKRKRSSDRSSDSEKSQRRSESPKTEVQQAIVPQVAGVPVGLAIDLSAQAAQVFEVLNAFCMQNRVDQSAAATLRNMRPEQQVAVMQEGPLAGSNPSAVLMARIRKVQSATTLSSSAGSTERMAAAVATGDPISLFVASNKLDFAAENALRQLTIEQCCAVLNEGGVTGCHNPSAVLMGRIRKVQLGQNPRGS